MAEGTVGRRVRRAVTWPFRMLAKSARGLGKFLGDAVEELGG